MSAPVVAVIGTNRQLDALTPLRAEYHRRGIGEVAVLTDHPLPPGAVSEVADHVDAVLMAYPRHRAPSTVVPWPATATARGRRIPIGLVPDHRDSLQRFALAAAAVHARPEQATCETVSRCSPSDPTAISTSPGGSDVCSATPAGHRNQCSGGRPTKSSATT